METNRESGAERVSDTIMVKVKPSERARVERACSTGEPLSRFGRRAILALLEASEASDTTVALYGNCSYPDCVTLVAYRESYRIQRLAFVLGSVSAMVGKQAGELEYLSDSKGQLTGVVRARCEKATADRIRHALEVAWDFEDGCSDYVRLLVRLPGQEEVTARDLDADATAENGTWKCERKT